MYGPFVVIIISYIFIKLVMKYAKKFNFLDIPNDRSHHNDIVPRGAGIGFVFAIFMGVAFFHFHFLIEYWYVFLSIFFVFVVGVIDDRYCVSAKLKFIVISFSVWILWINGLGIDTFGSWFGYKIYLPTWIILPFSMFAITGFTNALNLIDGIDGLAGSIAIVILLFFSFIGYKHYDMLMIVLSVSSVASLIPFLFLNWNPAKIFMGDSGSLTLGFIVSLLSILSIKYIHPITIFYLTAIPILDTLVVMTRRIRRKKSPFSPDKTHIHHILVKFFDNDVKKTVIFIVMIQIIFSLMGYALIDLIRMNSSGDVPVYALIGFLLMFLIFYMIFTGMKKRQKAIDRNSNIL